MKHTYKRALSLSILFIICISSLIFGAIKPETSAEAVFVAESSTDSIIYSKEADKKMYPASLTKLVTALVTLDNLKETDIITVGEEINTIPAGASTSRVKVGETLTIENALRGLLLPSGNDLSCTLALNVVNKIKGTNLSYEEAEVEFAKLMNEKAVSLGATHSNFVNPNGLHNDNHYSTARDLYIISKAFLKNSTLSSIVGMANFSGDGADRSIYSDKTISTYNWTNTNSLISSSTYKYEYTTGIKTGSTAEAGKCLAASAEKDGIQLISIMLNSTEEVRWRDTASLFEYGFNNFKFTSLQHKGSLIDKVQVMNYNLVSDDTLDIVADKDIEAYINSDNVENIDKIVKYNSDVNTSNENQVPRLRLPLKAGQSIGTVSYKVDNEVIFETELKAPKDVSINVADNADKYKAALKQKRLKSFISITLKVIVIALIAVVVIMALMVIRVRMIRKRRRKRRRRRSGSTSISGKQSTRKRKR